MVWRAVRHLQSTPHKGSRLSRGIALQTQSGDAETAAVSKSQPDGGDADGGVVVPSAVMRVQWVVPNVDAFSTSMDRLAAQPPSTKAEPRHGGAELEPAGEEEDDESCSAVAVRSDSSVVRAAAGLLPQARREDP